MALTIVSATACGTMLAAPDDTPSGNAADGSAEGASSQDASQGASQDGSNDPRVVSKVDGGRLVWVVRAGVDGDEVDTVTARADDACTAELGRPAFAWVASEGVAPLARAPSSNGPWVDVAGDIVADSRASLARGALKTGIRFTLDTTEVAGEVWTGTRADGGTGVDCNHWKSQRDTAIVGLLGATDARWTEARTTDCLGTRPFVCFEK